MNKNIKRFLSLLVVVTLSLNFAWAERVSPEAAAEIAAQFTNAQPQLRRLHKTPRQGNTMRLAHKVYQNKSDKEAIYVFNQENNQGFVIVSADDRTAEEVLGYSEEGSFDAEHINPNLKWWLDRYAEEITVLQTIDDSEFIEEPVSRKAKQVTAIAPLLKNSDGKEITWYQLAPYNNLCPTDARDNTKCYTGCVATAAAQVMYKWRHPAIGKGSSSYTWENCMVDLNENYECTNHVDKELSATYEGVAYDWDNMLPAYQGKSYTNAQANAVATLMYHVGVACEMEYGGETNEGSGAWTDYLAYGLKTYFGYDFDKYITTYSKSNYGDAHEGVTAEFSVSVSKFETYFNADLEEGRPIVMGGSSSSSGGHEFVCNGRDSNGKFYINWGWEGSGNGYYALSSLKPSGTSYNFSSTLDAIIGLRPNITGHKVVVSGTGCTIIPSADGIENGNALTATIKPTDDTYDFTSLTVKLGSTTLTSGTHYTLSDDKKTLTIKASAITGDESNDLTITCVWTKNRYKYELLGENCTEEVEGMLAKNAELNITIIPDAGYTLNNAACWDVEMGGNALTFGTDFTYDANTNTFRIASVTGDVNILAYGSVEVNWYSLGELHTTNVAVSGKLVLPYAPEACEGKDFVGWITNSTYSSNDAPTFAKKGDAVAAGAKYYAVFATKGEGGSTSWDLVTDDSSLQKGDILVIACKSKNVTAGDISGTIMSSVESTFSGNQISSLGEGTVELTLGGSTGAWTLSSTSGLLGATDVKKVAWEDGTTTWSISISGDDATIQNGTSSYGRFLYNSSSPRFTTYSSTPSTSMLLPQLYRKSGVASYSAYTTSCVPPTYYDITLNAGANGSLKTTPETKAVEGAKVTVTATPNTHYDLATLTVKDEDNATVELSGEGNVRTFTMPAKAVTVSATFAEQPKYAVRFFNNGTQVGETQNLYAGEKATKPATDPSACEGYTFVGWWTAELAADNTDAKTWVSDFTVNGAQDYYAVYSQTEEEGEPQLTNNYAQITSTSDLTTGNYLIVANNSGNYNAMSTTWKDTYYLAGTSVTPSLNVITTTTSSIIWELTVVDGKVTIKNGSDYLYIAKSTSGTKTYYNIKLGNNTTDNKFTYSYSSDQWYIRSATYTDRVIEYYTTNTRWAYYTDADAPVYLYKQQSEIQSTTYYTTETNCAACESKLTIKKGTAAHGTFALSKEDGEYESCSKIVVNVTDITPATGYTFKAITQSGLAEGVTIDQDNKKVTYEKGVTGTSTISVEFEALPKYEVRFYNNGKLIDTQEVIKGNNATAPVIGTCEGYTFVGWWTAELAEDNKESKTWITDFTISEEKEFFAIYSRVEGGTGADFDGKTEGTYKIYAKADDTKYYAKGLEMVSSTATSENWKITSTTKESEAYEYVFAKSGSGFSIKQGDKYIAYGTSGTNLINSDAAYTWTFATGTKGTWRVNSATSNRAFIFRLGTIYQFGGYSTTNVTASGTEYYDLEICASSTTYYTSTVTCGGGGTDVENATAQERVAVKAIINGQIVIIRGEQMYTITGARIQ